MTLIEKLTHRDARREARHRGLKPAEFCWLPMKEGFHRWRVLTLHRGRVTIVGRLTPNEIAERR